MLFYTKVYRYYTCSGSLSLESQGVNYQTLFSYFHVTIRRFYALFIPFKNWKIVKKTKLTKKNEVFLKFGYLNTNNLFLPWNYIAYFKLHSKVHIACLCQSDSKVMHFLCANPAFGHWISLAASWNILKYV